MKRTHPRMIDIVDDYLDLFWERQSRDTAAELSEEALLQQQRLSETLTSEELARLSIDFELVADDKLYAYLDEATPDSPEFAARYSMNGDVLDGLVKSNPALRGDVLNNHHCPDDLAARIVHRSTYADCHGWLSTFYVGENFDYLFASHSDPRVRAHFARWEGFVASRFPHLVTDESELVRSAVIASGSPLPEMEPGAGFWAIKGETYFEALSDHHLTPGRHDTAWAMDEGLGSDEPAF